ncbi:ribose-5-phosphate isomerase RpiA [Parvularcula sp. LCG005]|uniref:ribose-5-phosphate isomerase RpiA n=1 Tax=Parvularcula sp. LCG005 TaxID=3078805 RepID=UPI0029436846|nr:ribose-5-phosphate isomerase RpiA [Parvularcula sp. LCG005]WOI54353.1 ribose-5-phosphate isomerase RpiA [Parvularcula sp. LCG005]
MTSTELKKRAALEALTFIQDGMTVGLGTGSTAAPFIEALGKRVAEGLEIVGVPTSEAAAKLARQSGIELIIPDETTQIDVTVDGADEIDPDGHLIKGGGGAHQREKIIAAASRQLIIVADSSKKVSQLGQFPLPIEIDPFCFSLTVRRIRETFATLGYDKVEMQLRPKADQDGIMLTDGGHLLLDARMQRIKDPAALDQALTLLPGVISCGLFINMASMAIIAGEDGVERLTFGAR